MSTPVYAKEDGETMTHWSFGSITIAKPTVETANETTKAQTTKTDEQTSQLAMDKLAITGTNTTTTTTTTTPTKKTEAQEQFDLFVKTTPTAKSVSFSTGTVETTDGTTTQ